MLSERLDSQKHTSSSMDHWHSTASEPSMTPHDAAPGSSQHRRRNDLASGSLAGLFVGSEVSSHAPHLYTHPHSKSVWLSCQSVLFLTCNGRIRPIYPRLRAEHPPQSGAVVSSTSGRCAFFIYDFIHWECVWIEKSMQASAKSLSALILLDLSHTHD